MPTLRRMLKYTPAVVMVLLVVVWVGSVSRSFGISVNTPAARILLGCERGTLEVSWVPELVPDPWYIWAEEPIPESALVGSMLYGITGNGTLSSVGLPVPLLLSALLPLAIGPFLSFRFRLWHYLAYTALVAIELAYYLRWQE